MKTEGGSAFFDMGIQLARGEEIMEAWAREVYNAPYLGVVPHSAPIPLVQTQSGGHTDCKEC